MAQDVVQVLTVKTGNSEKTIKDLRKEIADLKKTLETTAIGTDDFKRASDELAIAQANLKTVLADGKAVTDAVEGSYNHLVATMANLKKEWKATADEAKRSEIGAKIDEINTQLKEMDASIGNNQRNVGNYKNDIIGAFQEIKESTDTYKDDWREVSDATEKTRAKFESVQKTAAGLTAGFAAVQGTMALLGTENEALEKTFVKVQSAMAIAQGVGGLKDLIEGVSQAQVAFKGAGMGAKAFITSLSGVQKAIIATGIGALVVAIGALIANWDKVTKVMGKADDEVKDLSNDIENLKKKMKYQDGDLDLMLRLREIAGATRGELIQTQREQTRLQLQDAQKNLDKANKLLNESNRRNRKKRQEAYDEAVRIEQELYDELKALNEEYTLWEAEQRQKKVEDQKAAAAQAAADAEALEKKLLEEYKTLNEEITNEYQMSDYEREIADIKKEYDDRLALLKDLKENELITETEYQERLAKIKKIVGDKTTEVLTRQDQERIERILTGIDKMINQEIFDKEIEVEKQLLEQKDGLFKSAEQKRAELLHKFQLEKLEEEEIGLLAQEQVLTDELKIYTGTIEGKIALEEKLAEVRNQLNENGLRQLQQSAAVQKATWKDIVNAVGDSASAVGDVLGDVADLIGEENEHYKDIMVAQGILNAISSSIATYNSIASIPLVGPYLAPVMAAAALATNLAAVDKMRRTSPDNLDTNFGTTSQPSVNMSENMPISYTRELVTDSETTELNKNTKVIVVESDITSTQDKVRVAETNSSF